MYFPSSKPRFVPMQFCPISWKLKVSTSSGWWLLQKGTTFYKTATAHQLTHVVRLAVFHQQFSVEINPAQQYFLCLYIMCLFFCNSHLVVSFDFFSFLFLTDWNLILSLVCGKYGRALWLTADNELCPHNNTYSYLQGWPSGDIMMQRWHFPAYSSLFWVTFCLIIFINLMQ